MRLHARIRTFRKVRQLRRPASRLLAYMKTIGIFVFPGVQSLDVSGPMDVFAEANRFLPPQAQYQIEVIGSKPGLLSCSNGLLIQAHRPFYEVSDAFDCLLIAGGPKLPQHELCPESRDWLRYIAPKARQFGSVCSGAFILARAGLLEGHTVTNHWNHAAALALLCPTTVVEPDQLYIQDGPLITSAGITAGIDMSLHLLAADHGRDIALQVARRLVVFTQRAGGQSQFSPYLAAFARSKSPLARIQQYVLANLLADLSVPALARVANMSVRNLSRTFAKEANMSPYDFVENARIDVARALLEDPRAPLKSVAYQCGFNDTRHMREIFKKRLGLSPRQYRLNFGVANRRP